MLRVMLFSVCIMIAAGSAANTHEPPPSPIKGNNVEQKLPRTDQADKSRGQLLYENHCRVCHTSIVHIRKNKKVRKIQDIYYWANRWSKELKLKWKKDELDAVVRYLNKKYYVLAK